MQKTWLKQYPQGVPAEIKVDLYASLVALLEESFRQHRDQKAYLFMGKPMTFGQLDDHSRAFAAFLQSSGLAPGDRVALMMLNVPQYPVAVAGVLRAGMVEALNSDYVERARLAGIPQWRISIMHALPSALVPMLSATAYFVAGLLATAVVVESVFKFPGAGGELLRAISQREIPTIQAIAFLAALAVIVANLIADLAILVLDPRVRTSTRHG